MKKCLLFPATFCLLLISSLIPVAGIAQLCTGSLGDPVVDITFGAGANPGPSLNPSITTLTHVNHDCPNDGYYAITSETSNCFGDAWHTVTKDHTGNPGGYFMLVNASYQPSDFYVAKVDGLCPNTTYQFASWIMNLLKSDQSIRPNLTFNIEKVDGSILQTFNTGDIPVEGYGVWRQYGFFFKNGSDASIVLRIRNNAPGGIGNDLGLDDITFSPCGPQVKATIAGSSTNSSSMCEGNITPVTLNGEVMAGYVNPVYQWQATENGTDWVDIPGASSTSLISTPAAVGSYGYRLSVAESANLGIPSCRVNSNVIDVFVRSKPTISFPPAAPACEGSTAVLEAAVNYHSPGGAITKWFPPLPSIKGTPSRIPGDSVDTGTEQYSVTGVTLAGTGYFKVEIKNLYGCIATDSSTLTILPRPVTTFTTTGPACEKVAVSFEGSASITNPYTISSFLWDFGNGDTSRLQNPAAIFDTPGDHLVRYLAFGSNGCVSDTAFKSITIHASPTADFKLPEVCLGDPFAEFTDQSSDSGGNGNFFQYSWQFGDPSGTSNTSNLKDPTHRYLTVGQYNVSLQVTSVNACIGDTTKQITVNGSLPKSIFSISPAAVRCSDDSIVLVNQSTIDYGDLTKIEIYWDYDRDPTNKTIEEDPMNTSTFSHAYANTPVAGAQYRIRYIVYSGSSCMNESEQLVNISKSPTITFNPLEPVCQELSPFTITQAIETTGLPGAGSYSGPGVNASGLFTPNMVAPGRNTLYYSYAGDNGCTAKASQEIIVHATPVVDAGPERTMLTGGQITLQATAKGDNLQYAWSPSASITNPAELQPVVRPASETMYTLQVHSAAGCQAEDNALVKVVENIAIPNAFTPNGDGKNDTWKIPYIDSYPGFVVQVYNRYGQLVYQSTNGIVNWDGTVGGKPQDAGTYVYVFDRKQFGGIAKGTILLIR
ncbi:MAG TPA: PKD domain-containing protein [Flavitalea sp.]|nr:PKD domain-containing protein [Flavitalea sp.]